MNEVRATGEIAPLVRSPGLQQTSVVFIQSQEIHTLEDLVGKLGVGNTGI